MSTENDRPAPDVATKAQPDLEESVELPDEEDPPIVRILNALFADAVGRGASHVHIDPDEAGVRVRLRIDGQLHDARRLPRIIQPALFGRLKVISGLDVAERRRPQQGRFTLALEGQHASFMVATLPLGNYGERMVLRRSDALARIPLPELGLEGLKQLQACLAARSGLIVIAGANRCGRTTTLYAIAEELAQAGRVVALVDEVRERPLQGVTHVAVDRSCELGVEQILDAAYSQDFDVFVVGALSTSAAVTAAIRAVLDGRLVVAGVHGRSAADAISLLRDMASGPGVLSHGLSAVVAQRLVRRLCDCRQPDTLPSAWRPHGCARCADTGYRGHALASTLCVVDEPLREAIRARAPLTLPGPTLHDAALALVARGITSLSEALSDPSTV